MVTLAFYPGWVILVEHCYFRPFLSSQSRFPVGSRIRVNPSKSNQIQVAPSSLPAPMFHSASTHIPTFSPQRGSAWMLRPLFSTLALPLVGFAGDSWTQFRGPNRDGTTDAKGLP